jgi:hypothetical protein
MSIEIGASCTYVYLGENGGQTLEALQQLKNELIATENHASEMAEALDRVISSPEPQEAPRLLARQNKYLLGIDEYAFSSGSAVDGLIFAEGIEKQENGAFSFIRMATWISQARQRLGSTDEQLSNQLIDMSLVDVESDRHQDWGPWGIPVQRTTRIVPINPNPDEVPAGYIYGHRKDFEAIKQLSLPDELKRVFAEVTNSWHNAELNNDTTVVASKIRTALEL